MLCTLSGHILTHSSVQVNEKAAMQEQYLEFSRSQHDKNVEQYHEYKKLCLARYVFDAVHGWQRRRQLCGFM